MSATGTESRDADIAERQERGIAKYGTTVQDNPLTLRRVAFSTSRAMPGPGGVPAPGD